MTATDHALELVVAAARAASDKLAQQIVAFDVSEQLAITDAFLIASATNDRQVKAIVDEVEDKLREIGAKPIRREGERDGRWVLIDYGEIVVHVQHEEERQFYALERLWRDCPTIELPADVDAAHRWLTRRALLLLRHGRTAWNPERRIQGHLDAGLDETGHAQARAAAKEIAAAPTRPAVELGPRPGGRHGGVRRRGVRARGGHRPPAAGVRPRGDAGPHSTQSVAETRPGGVRALPARATSRRPTASRPPRWGPGWPRRCASCSRRPPPGRVSVAVSHGAAIRVGLAELVGWGAPLGLTLGRPRQLRLGGAHRGRAGRPAAADLVQPDGPGRPTTRPISPRPHRLAKIPRVAQQSPGNKRRGCGAAGSASAWHAEGQGFESPQLHGLRPGLRPGFRRFGRRSW